MYTVVLSSAVLQGAVLFTGRSSFWFMINNDVSQHVRLHIITADLV